MLPTPSGIEDSEVEEEELGTGGDEVNDMVDDGISSPYLDSSLGLEDMEEARGSLYYTITNNESINGGDNQSYLCNEDNS